MTSLASWISPGVLHSLGWALIHSLWQGVAVAALAAALMALCRRPSTRYAIGMGALAVMLAAPVAMFFLLRSADTLDPAFVLTGSRSAAVTSSLADLGATIPTDAFVTGAADVAGKPAAIVSASPIQLFASQNGLPWLVGAWLLGVTIFSLRFAGGFLLLEHKRRRQSTAPNAHILKICLEMQRRLGLNCTIRYLECSWLQAPAVIGWIRPIILLPVIALTGFSEEQWRAVIAHELAHIRRLDAFVNLFQILAETLLFYHPAIWWLNKRIRAERELCCDEVAVSLCGDPVAYARALALMEEWRSAPVLAMAVNRGPLSERILYVLDRKSLDARARMFGLTGGLVFLTAALAAGSASFKVAYPTAAFDVREISRILLPPARQVDKVERGVEAARIKGIGSNALASQSKVAPQQERSGRTDLMPRSTVSSASVAERSPVIGVPSLPLSAAPAPKLSQTGEGIASLAPAAPNNPSAGAAPANQGPPDATAQAVLNDSSASARPLADSSQPIGVGDPNATVCRKPEHPPGSNGPDQIVCMKNTYWFALWIRGKSLGADGKTVLEPQNPPVVTKATGEGDPDAVVCQKFSEQTASRLPTPKLCFRNRYWVRLKQQPNLAPGLPNEQLISALSRG